jgi:gamma-glutamylcysteine synthetase
MFTFGIEHEVAFFDSAGRFVDWTTTSFAELNQIIAQLPLYAGDSLSLYVGDAKIREKRWYLEGIERFSETGALLSFEPKGIEIRTTIHITIQAAVKELEQSFAQLCSVAEEYGYTAVLTSFNPYQTQYCYNPPLNFYEMELRNDEPSYFMEQLAMLSYGPDLNLALTGLSAEAVIDVGRKLTAYSAYIIPFSFGSPFYGGQLWEGLSARTFMRSGVRSTVRVYVEHVNQLFPSVPQFTTLARIPAEIGRIEFKAFDSCGDFSLYAALLALLKGLVLDESLLERATSPDTALHRYVARVGFSDSAIAEQTAQIIAAAEVALNNDDDAILLIPLKRMLARKMLPAHYMIQEFHQTGSIEKVLQQGYKKSL